MKARIEKKALYLATLLFNGDSTQVIGERTYYYLSVDNHNLWSRSRGFGMKKTIKHKTSNNDSRLIELYELVLKDMRCEASFKGAA